MITAAGTAFVLRMKPTYSAETLILVDSQKIPEKYVASTVVSDVQDRLATISQEILSSTRLKKIIEDYKLYSDKRDKKSVEEIVDLMRSDVSVRVEKGWSNNRPGAFRISYEGSDPSVVAAVANRLASLYIDENMRVREVQAEGTSQFLDGQLREAKRTLDELEVAVSRYKLEHNGELPQQESALNTSLMRLQTELQGTQDAINRAQQNNVIYDAEQSTIESRLSALLPRSEVTNDGAAPPVRQAAPAEPLKSSQVLSENLKALRLRYSEEHPEVKRVKAALAGALKVEQQTAAAKAPVPTATAPAEKRPPTLAPLSAETEREIEQLRQRLGALKAQREIGGRDAARAEARRESILREMGVSQAQLKKLPIREQEMAALTRDYEVSKANYRSLLDKKTSAEMASEMERRQKAERFIVLDAAQVPEKPFKPKRPLLIGMTSLMGLALGIALAFAAEWNKDLLLGEWELPAGVVVLGRLPTINVERAGTSRPGRKKAAARNLATTGSALMLVLAEMVHSIRGGI